MTVSSVIKNALVLPSALLLTYCFLYISAQSLSPEITITPRVIKLKSISEPTSKDQIIIRCSSGFKNLKLLDAVNSLKINLKGEATDATDEGVVLATQAERTATKIGRFRSEDKYRAIGQLGPKSTSWTISLAINSATCQDAGRYRCAMSYTLKSEGKTGTGHTDGYLDVPPYDFSVTRSPDKKPIAVGDKLVLSCSAVVGTLMNDRLVKKSQLTWVYRSRESAIERIYSQLDEVLLEKLDHKVLGTAPCSEKQKVTLNLEVSEARDSLRDYFCVAVRYQAGKRTVYVGGGLNTNISIPSFEKPKKASLGIGGFVGIGLGALAMLSGITFGAIWCLRRTKKKRERKQEIEARKNLIEERRKSITSVVESRKNVAQDRESSVNESDSAVESSVVTTQPVEESRTAG